jgi:hypothetical protein
MNRAVKNDPIRDAMIEAEVSDALRPYEDEGVYPPEVLEDLRRMLRIVMRTHPTAARLLEQLRPRPAPEESGKEDVSVFNGALRRATRAENE